MNRTHQYLALLSAVAISLISDSGANPVAVPFATDFSSEFGAFYAPTGNGYNWSHDWRAQNYQSWVSSANRTVTASMQARELAGEEFFLKVSIDPVEVSGSSQSFGLAACASNRTFGSYYLADVKPAANTFRILQISGGTTTIAAERAVQNLSLTDLEPFELELTGTRSGNSITLDLTVRRGAQSDTLSGTDSTSLDGSYFGLRCRNDGSSYECHFDNYELRPLHTLSITSGAELLAPVGELFQTNVAADNAATFQVDGALPSWLGLTPAGLLSGTPTPADTGTHDFAVLATSPDGATATQSLKVIVPAATGAIISEFVADNDDGLADGEGDASDWVELLNPTSAAIDLTGWHLTDDPVSPAKWTFPAGTTLPPLDTLVVFASGKPLPGHASFRLNDSAGSYIALVRPDNSIASEFADYPAQREDVSYGAFGDHAERGYLLEPSPGALNVAAGYEGFTSDTKFSVARGFFDAAFSVDVTCSTPGATIVTTTDGSVPTLSNGDQSASPSTVSITGTTVLRAAAFADGLVATNTDTQTYLFLGDIRTQTSAEAIADGWPSGSVNGQSFNYGMDTDITNSISITEFEEAMTDIPTISFVTDLDNFNDPLTGFWVNAENRGRGWERPVSVELIDPDGTEGFQIDAGVRLRGGWSRQGSNAKHSFHLYFRSVYGAGKLDYPLFGDEGTSTFDALDLRATQGRSWHFSNSSDATFNRDVFAREIQRDMGQPYSRSRHYHLYINGQYFGLFQSQERVNSDYAASYFGGDKDDYDVIKTRTKPHRVESLDGDPGAWTRLYDAAVAGFTSDAAYFAVQGLDAAGDPDPSGDNLVDVDNLIDYMTAIFYTGQTDGPVNLGANVPKNFFALRPRDGSFGFRFFVHDNEDSLNSSGANVTGNNNTGDRLTYFNPKWLHQRLASNARYRQRFGDRAHRHFFNAGALTTAASQARFQGSADPIQNAIIGESARWGDARRGTPYNQADWQNATNGKLNSFIPGRARTVVNQLRGRNLYPDTDAPAFSQHGGQVASGFQLAIDALDGEIYYTLDGSDPSGAGAILFDPNSTSDTLLPANSAGWTYLVTATAFSDSEVTVGHPSYGSSDWKHPDFDTSTWATGTAPFGYGNVGTPSWTTQIDDGGSPRNRTTYLRKTFDVTGAANYSNLTINIRRDDGAIVYLNGREIARSNMPAGSVGYSDFASGNASGSGESSYFPESHSLVPGELIDGTNTLAVEIHQATSSSSDLVIDVSLLGTNTNGSGIPITADTTVKTRALEGGEWSALNEATFFTSAPASASTLVISEIFYNPPGTSEDTEYIELLNISSTETIHLDGLAFTDGITFEFPPGLALAPGERVLIVKNTAAFEAEFGVGLPVFGEFGGSLDNGGEGIAIGTITAFTYDDSFPWPEPADGDGRSLVLVGGDPIDPQNWRPSAADSGSPGSGDTTTFGGGDFAQYAFGGHEPFVDAPLKFSFPRNLAAADVEYILETSDDLRSWTAATGWTKVGETIYEDHFSITTWSPGTPGSHGFVRMRAEVAP